MIALASTATTEFSFAMFAIGAIPANLLYISMARIVRARGIEFGMWNFQAPSGIAKFWRVLRAETDTGRRSTYTFVLAGFVIASMWCLYWFVAFAFSGQAS